MKTASAVPIPTFYYPDATTRRPRVSRLTKVRRPRPTLLEEGDEATHKQEVVCAAILALSLVSTVALCLWQLAVA